MRNFIKIMEEKKLEFYYIRHADTAGSKKAGIYDCDIDLSPLGLKQADLLAKRFEGKSFDCILSSPLIRCVKTAAAVAKGLEGKKTIEIVPELIENGTVPGYERVNLDLLKEIYPDITLCEDRIFDIKSNKTDFENDERAFALARYLKLRFTFGQRVLIFCHGSFGNHLLPKMVEMGEGNYILSLSNTGVSKVKYTPDGKQRLSFVNDISHLRPVFENFEFDT